MTQYIYIACQTAFSENGSSQLIVPSSNEETLIERDANEYSQRLEKRKVLKSISNNFNLNDVTVVGSRSVELDPTTEATISILLPAVVFIRDEQPQTLQLNLTTLAIIGSQTGKELVVDGEGTWIFDEVMGCFTFTPSPSLTKNPTPISYTITDADGNLSNTASITIIYYEAIR